MTTVRFNQPTLKTWDNFLDNLFNEIPSPKSSSFNFPPVNIIESNDDYELEINAAGRKKEEFKITVDKNILTVSFDAKDSFGEKNEEKKDDNEETQKAGKKFIKKEFVLSSFNRSFTLDEKINASDIQAKYENGILTLTLPKKEEVKVLPKEIAVQ